MKTTMKVQLNVRGLEYCAGPAFANRIDNALGKTAKNCVELMQKDIRKPKRGLAAGKGKKKARGAGGRVVSAPGESPANQLEELVNSIRTDHRALFTWDVAVGAYYGFYLEYGTHNRGGGVKMEPRPFFWKNLNIGVKQLSVNVTAEFKWVPETRVK